jgi:hypothetical protein
MESIFFNLKVKEVYDKEGKFVVPDSAIVSDYSLVKKPPFRLASGAVYIGQWDSSLTKR